MSDEIKAAKKRPGGPGSKMGPGEKPKNMKKAFGSLVSFSKACIPATVVALILATAGTIFSLIGPNKLQDLTNL
ncbi:MAG: hypothetical protein IJX24_00080, partial [Oscillospiraceae bacterium]|nr:hypothetical protein [Oscillospiraceae bacterium]